MGVLVSLKESVSDTIDFWAEAYFRLEVTTSPRSRVEQKRDLQLFLDFMGQEERQLDRRLWTPRISRAFVDYLQRLKKKNGRWHSPALFLPAGTVAQAAGRLGVRTVNNIWNAVFRDADVEGRTCHSARHTMGKYLMEKTGNMAAVQKQLGHKNAAYFMQYARITGDELLEALDGR